MSLLGVFERSDESPRECPVVDVNMSSMPHSILYAVEGDDQSHLWLEQSTTRGLSRVIAQSIEVYCIGTKMQRFPAGSQVLQSVPARIPFVTAENIDSTSAKLFAWYKKRSVWRSTTIGTVEALDNR